MDVTTVLLPVVCVVCGIVLEKEEEFGVQYGMGIGWNRRDCPTDSCSGVLFSSLPPAAEPKENKNLGTLLVCNFFCRAVNLIGGLADLISGSWWAAVG